MLRLLRVRRLHTCRICLLLRLLRHILIRLLRMLLKRRLLRLESLLMIECRRHELDILSSRFVRRSTSGGLMGTCRLRVVGVRVVRNPSRTGSVSIKCDRLTHIRAWEVCAGLRRVECDVPEDRSNPARRL